MPWSACQPRHPDDPALSAGDRDGTEVPTPPQGTQSRFGWEIRSHALHDLTVDRCATRVADEVDRRLKQLLPGLIVQIDQRRDDRVRRRLGEAGVGDVAFRLSVGYQDHGL